MLKRYCGFAAGVFFITQVLGPPACSHPKTILLATRHSAESELHVPVRTYDLIGLVMQPFQPTTRLPYNVATSLRDFNDSY